MPVDRFSLFSIYLAKYLCHTKNIEPLWFGYFKKYSLSLFLKTTFTILFFTCNLLLIVFSILFLKMIDARAGAMILVGAGSGILIVIIGLIVLLNRYLKAPTQDSKN